jgi:hypothetical protein
MKVKLGPVTMQYKGQMEVVERDEKAYRAVLKGSAKEARGQGTAQATAHLQLVEDGGTTRGTVHADVALSGRAAAMGQGVIGSVTDSMMGQFATNLQAMLTGSGAPVLDATAVAEASSAGATQAAANGMTAAGAATAPPRPASVPPPAASASSLNAAALAKSVVMGQLREPNRVLQVLSVVAVIAYRLGLRSGRRERARYLGVVDARPPHLPGAGQLLVRNPTDLSRYWSARRAKSIRRASTQPVAE